MNQQEIIEGNKLIAEFMSIELFNHPTYGLMSCEEEHLDDQGCPTRLSYNLSWDWLMPVVEEIEELGNSFNINYIYCYLENSNGKKITDTTGTSKIEAVWLATIKFIKWYNGNKTINN
jgi:hypothetical protein